MVGGSETILVVEDDLPVQATVIELLTGLGYSVLRANDAQSALSILQSGIGIDLFTDVVMPAAEQHRTGAPGTAAAAGGRGAVHVRLHAQCGGSWRAPDPGVELLSKLYRQEDLARSASAAAGCPAWDDKTAPRQWVMVVEDQPQLLTLTCEMVEELGYGVRGYPDAETAAKALHEQRFDQLLLDVNLPGRSAGIRCRGAEDPAVAATGLRLRRGPYRQPPAGAFVTRRSASISSPRCCALKSSLRA